MKTGSKVNARAPVPKQFLNMSLPTFQKMCEGGQSVNFIWTENCFCQSLSQGCVCIFCDSGNAGPDNLPLPFPSPNVFPDLVRKVDLGQSRVLYAFNRLILHVMLFVHYNWIQIHTLGWWVVFWNHLVWGGVDLSVRYTIDIKVMQYQVKRASTRGKRFTLVLDRG